MNGLDTSPFQPNSLDVVYAGLQNTKHMQPVQLLVSPDSLITNKAGESIVIPWLLESL